MKYLDHSMLAMSFSTPISLYYVELFLFIFCFVENMGTTHFHKYIMDPVCPRKYWRNEYE